MPKKYFNPSMRYDLHFHTNFFGHDCPAKKGEYEVFDELGYRIVYCKNCLWASKRKLVGKEYE